MVNTVQNNNIVLIDPDEEAEVVAHLLLMMNAFVSIKTAEIATTLDKMTQYRERKEGRFPKLVSLTHHGRRKAYRIHDLKNWLKDPSAYQFQNHPLEDLEHRANGKDIRIIKINL